VTPQDPSIIKLESNNNRIFIGQKNYADWLYCVKPARLLMLALLG
jgi:hypothetical protein